MKRTSSIVLVRKAVNIYYSDSRNQTNGKKNRFFLPVGVKINNEKDFSKATGTLKGKYAEQNEHIYKIKKQIDELIETAISNHSSDIVAYLNTSIASKSKSFDIVVKKKSLNISECYEAFLEHNFKETQVEQDTISKWKVITDDLKRFGEAKGYVMMNDIDEHFKRALILFYEGDALSTIQKKFVKIDKFLKYYSDILPADILEANKKVKVRIYNPTIVSFTKEEMNWFNNFTGTVSEQKLVDIVLFSVQTGCNYVDMSELDKSYIINIKNRPHLTFSRGKTKTDCSVPLSKKAIDILEKYNYNMNMMVNQSFNQLIQKLLSKNELFQTKQRVKDVRTGNDIVMNRWQLITHKVCRKTFITNMLERNIPLNHIIGMVGHTDLGQMKYYMNTVDKDNDDILAALDTF